MASTHLKNISQIGSSPQVGVKKKNLWNHHLVQFFCQCCWCSNHPYQLQECCSLGVATWTVQGWPLPVFKSVVDPYFTPINGAIGPYTYNCVLWAHFVQLTKKRPFRMFSSCYLPGKLTWLARKSTIRRCIVYWKPEIFQLAIWVDFFSVICLVERDKVVVVSVAWRASIPPKCFQLP